ncbi:MAG TPA: TrmH family RNA methyltransferase [Acidobacteriota bacterium]|nr:TrmH family RNA methyltransferase [Acidobacteriota bacterium]
MPRTIPLYSENNDFQHAEVLKRNREKRQKNKEFFVEGVKPIEQLLQHEWDISSFLYSKDRALSTWAKQIIHSSKADSHFELPEQLMQKLSDKEEASELIAIARMKEDSLARISVKKDFLVVVFDRPSSPGNLGTIIRSCDALGAAGLIITGHAADIYDSKTIRASVGTLFSLPVIRISSPKDLLPWFEFVKATLGDLQIVGTSAKGTSDISEQNFKKPTVLLLGNETLGLSAQYKEMSHALVRIPINGAASSLNVSCAASITLYEIQRQRRA